jgi:hypothetical protein
MHAVEHRLLVAAMKQLVNTQSPIADLR